MTQPNTLKFDAFNELNNINDKKFKKTWESKNKKILSEKLKENDNLYYELQSVSELRLWRTFEFEGFRFKIEYRRPTVEDDYKEFMVTIFDNYGLKTGPKPKPLYKMHGNAEFWNYARSRSKIQEYLIAFIGKSETAQQFMTKFLNDMNIRIKSSLSEKDKDVKPVVDNFSFGRKVMKDRDCETITFIIELGNGKADLELTLGFNGGKFSGFEMNKVIVERKPYYSPNAKSKPVNKKSTPKVSTKNTETTKKPKFDSKPKHVSKPKQEKKPVKFNNKKSNKPTSKTPFNGLDLSGWS